MDNSNVLKFTSQSQNPELAELLKLIKKGESAAFGRLYDLYFLRIYRFIYYRVGHKETAEDLAEEVFLKVHAAIFKLDAEGAFEGWLYRIARNLIIDYYRKHKLTVALEDVENTLEYESNIIDVINLKQQQKILFRLIKLLNADEQSVIKMKFLEDLDNAVIAEVLNKSEGSVRVIQHRAINKLQKFIKEQSLND